MSVYDGLPEWLSPTQGGGGAGAAAPPWMADTNASTSPPPTDGGSQEPPRNPVNQMPVNDKKQSGQWSSWLEDPSNRAFMLSMGLSMMSGGWGGWSEQLAQAIGHGAKAAHETERGLMNPSARELPSDGGMVRGRRRGRRGVGTAGMQLASAPAPNSSAQAFQEFMQTDPTPEVWEAQNRPGGIVHAVFGGPQDYQQRAGLLHRVQMQSPSPQTDQGGFARDRAAPSGDFSEFPQPNRYSQPPNSEALLGMINSTNPAERARGYAWTQKLGLGVHTNQDGTREVVPRNMGDGTVAARAGQRDTAFSRNARVAAQGALLSLNTFEQYLEGTWYPRRAIEASIPWTALSDMEKQWERYAALPMHGVSGASVTNSEREMYVRSLKPNFQTDTLEQIKLKMNELRQYLLALQDPQGGTFDQVLKIRNAINRRFGVPEMSAEEFASTMRGLGFDPATPPGGLGGSPRPGSAYPGAVRTTPYTEQPTAPPSSTPAQPTPGGASGEWQTLPDGTRYRVR